MSTSLDNSGYDTTAFDRGVNAVLRFFSAERAKYEGYVRANKFVAILQAQVQKFLARSKN